MAAHAADDRPDPVQIFLLTLLFLIVHVIEKVIEGLFHGKTVVESLPSIGGGGLVGLVSAPVIMSWR